MKWQKKELILINQNGDRFETTLGELRAEAGSNQVINYLIGCALMDIPLSVTTSERLIILEKGESEFVFLHERCHQTKGHADDAKGIVCNMEDEMEADLYAARVIGIPTALQGLRSLKERIRGKGFWRVIRSIFFLKGIQLINQRIAKLESLSV